MKAEFEEKQYEQALNFELVSENRFLYTPGQCLENVLGFDAGIFSSNIDFWNLFPSYGFYDYFSRRHFLHPDGIELRKEMWDVLDREIDNDDFFPQVKFNLFIQHKRPAYLSRSNATEWDSWDCPYFRYNLTSHQQEALENLDNQVRHNAIVVYASPAFYTLRALWDAKMYGTLVNNSNFIQASSLSNHSKFTYSEAGNYGIGFSEPEKIEGFNLKEKIAELFNNEEIVKNSEMYRELEKVINNVMRKNSFYSEMYIKMTQENENINNKLLKTFRKINVFLYLTNSTMMSGVDKT